MRPKRTSTAMAMSNIEAALRKKVARLTARQAGRVGSAPTHIAGMSASCADAVRNFMISPEPGARSRLAAARGASAGACDESGEPCLRPWTRFVRANGCRDAVGDLNPSTEALGSAVSAGAAQRLGPGIRGPAIDTVAHGTLPVSQADIAIRWAPNMGCGEGHRLDLTWTEQGVPAVAIQPKRQGLEQDSIGKPLSCRLGVETYFEFRGGGAFRRISFPIEPEACRDAQGKSDGP